MQNLKIFTGNIGCGKSFLASRFAKQFNDVVVNMDSIQQMIGGGEYGIYDKAKKEVYHSAETSIIESALKAGLSVVVDRTNMDRKIRARFIEIGNKYGAKIVSYNWGQPDTIKQQLSLGRRLKAPHGIPEQKWRDVCEYMQKSYEEPTLEEGFSEIIVPPYRYKFHAFDFDGTLVENAFPSIGDIIYGRVEYLNKLWEDISNVIIITTCRSGNFENQARKFLLDNKIPFDFINENPMFETGSRKLFANVYYDDRNKYFPETTQGEPDVCVNP